MRQVTVDAEFTVKKDSAEGEREPCQGPVGYEPRFLGAGRNVTDSYPWDDKLLRAPDTSPDNKP